MKSEYVWSRAPLENESSTGRLEETIHFVEVFLIPVYAYLLIIY